MMKNTIFGLLIITTFTKVVYAKTPPTFVYPQDCVFGERNCATEQQGENSPQSLLMLECRRPNRTTERGACWTRIPVCHGPNR